MAKGYFFIYSKNGDRFGDDEPFQTFDDAFRAADMKWYHLTDSEKKAAQEFCVAFGDIIDDDGFQLLDSSYDVPFDFLD